MPIFKMATREPEEPITWAVIIEIETTLQMLLWDI
jgi:hypothetical protein